jgi:hypothetical protein
MSEYPDFIRDFPKLSIEKLVPNKMYEAVLLIEAQNVVPENYIPENLIHFKTIYNWNSKFIGIINKVIPAVRINGFPLFDNYSWLEQFPSVDEKIDGICLIARANGRAVEGDISILREVVFDQITDMTKHAYGKTPFCGEHYRGVIGESIAETYPSSLAKLKKLSEYKFSLCFENCHHELWSWDYITEKIFDCFKAKTVPIYLGCFNIEEHIPPELYIDFRKFQSVPELTEYMKSLSGSQIEEMTEKAYAWVKQSRWGNIADLRQQLAAYR